jgi:hypothetical protein
MRQLCARAFIVLLTVTLAACGGGQLEARIGGGGTGSPLSVGMGSVDGFGSVIVNGIRYDERDATVLLDQRPDQPTAVSAGAIRLGMQISLEHRDFVISRATLAAEVIGPVTSTGASSLIVLGQTIRINSDPARPTAFGGFDNLNELAAGAWVEVHGQRSGNDDISATRIELRPASPPVLRVAGTVANRGATSFTIGGLTVTTGQAAIVPAGQSISNGARVAVWSDLPPSGLQLAAKVVRVGDAPPPVGATVIVDGTVANAPVQARFVLAGLMVDAAGAQFSGGTIAGLTPGRALRVRGVMEANLLRAIAVEFLPAKATELTGPITDFISPDQSFKLRSSDVRVTPQTTYSGGSSGNLGDGVVVRLEGSLVNGVVEAQKLEFVALPAASQSVIFGKIIGTVATAADGSKTFLLEGVNAEIRTTLNTEYKQGTAAELLPGRSLKLKVRPQGVQLVADEVQFRDSTDDPVVFEIEGIAKNVVSGSFAVGGKTITLTGATVYLRNGVATTRADLIDGIQVEVQAARNQGQLVALVVDVRTQPAAPVTVRGLVNGRSPPNALEFWVGAQRVNVASNPQVVPGNATIADIVNGTDLEVTGTVANGLLTATRVRIR